MRFFQLISIVIMVTSVAFAQPARQGAYLEAGGSSIGLKNRSVLMGRVSFGWRPIAHGVIGGMYNFSPNDITISDYTIVGFSYGGLFAEYDVAIAAAFGLRFQILAAGGGMRFSTEGIINFLMYEPAVMLDYKLSRDASVSVGFSYGFATGIDDQSPFSTNDLSKYRLFVSTRYGIAIFPDVQ